MTRLQHDFWNAATEIALGVHPIQYHVVYGNLPLGRLSPRFSPDQVGNKINLREIMKPVKTIHLEISRKYKLLLSLDLFMSPGILQSHSGRLWTAPGNAKSDIRLSIND
jgi:hypothetical protein